MGFSKIWEFDVSSQEIDFINGPEFMAFDHRWRFEFEIRPTCSIPNKCCSISLKMISDGIACVSIGMAADIFGDSVEKRGKVRFMPGKKWGIESIPSIYRSLFTGHIRVCCYMYKSEILDPQSSLVLENKLKNSLKLFNEEYLTDFRVIVEDRPINVHRFVLASESGVFKSMFDCDMEESNSNQVIISDFSYDAIQAMVKFMYCYEVEKMEILAPDLLILSDKYDVQSLKIYTEEYLSNTVTIYSVMKFFHLAQRVNAERLSKNLGNFFKKHYNKIVETEEWRSGKFDSDVLKSLIESIANK